MLGHTDTATINARRPLTPNMRGVLVGLVPRPRRDVDISQNDKNALRALCDRKYATWQIDDRTFHITDAGRQALETKEPARGRSKIL